MSSLKMIISIVPHDKGEKLTRAAMESGCQGGTVLMGRSLATSSSIVLSLFLHILYHTLLALSRVEC